MTTGVEVPVEDGEGKNVVESRLGIVEEKSGGVTSETNHGISFGLYECSVC